MLFIGFMALRGLWRKAGQADKNLAANPQRVTTPTLWASLLIIPFMVVVGTLMWLTGPTVAMFLIGIPVLVGAMIAVDIAYDSATHGAKTSSVAASARMAAKVNHWSEAEAQRREIAWREQSAARQEGNARARAEWEADTSAQAAGLSARAAKNTPDDSTPAGAMLSKYYGSDTLGTELDKWKNTEGWRGQ